MQYEQTFDPCGIFDVLIVCLCGFFMAFYCVHVTCLWSSCDSSLICVYYVYVMYVYGALVRFSRCVSGVCGRYAVNMTKSAQSDNQ